MSLGDTQIVQFICLDNDGQTLMVFTAPESTGAPCYCRKHSGTIAHDSVQSLERFVGKTIGGELYEWLSHKTDVPPWVS